MLEAVVFDGQLIMKPKTDTLDFNLAFIQECSCIAFNRKISFEFNQNTVTENVKAYENS